MEAEYVKNHFITNPEWKAVFLKHYPNWTAETYVDDALKLYRANGYDVRVETRPFKSETYKHIVDMGLYRGDESLYSLRGHEPHMVEQVIINSICNYEIDFSTFK